MYHGSQVQLDCISEIQYYAVTENRYIDISKAKRMMNDKGSLDRVGI
jgi:hypothetical protein